MSVKGQHVLIIDDVLDHGITLEQIAKYCDEQGASSVKTLALVEKQVVLENRYMADFIGLSVEDRYIFGLGMDYKEFGRTLNRVMAVAREDDKKN
jgi:hypoxanthine phosphoribosyltransferase